MLGKQSKINFFISNSLPSGRALYFYVPYGVHSFIKSPPKTPSLANWHASFPTLHGFFKWLLLANMDSTGSSRGTDGVIVVIGVGVNGNGVVDGVRVITGGEVGARSNGVVDGVGVMAGIEEGTWGNGVVDGVGVVTGIEEGAWGNGVVDGVGVVTGMDGTV